MPSCLTNLASMCVCKHILPSPPAPIPTAPVPARCAALTIPLTGCWLIRLLPAESSIADAILSEKITVILLLILACNVQFLSAKGCVSSPSWKCSTPLIIRTMSAARPLPSCSILMASSERASATRARRSCPCDSSSKPFGSRVSSQLKRSCKALQATYNGHGLSWPLFLMGRFLILAFTDTLKYDCTCQVYQTPSKACSSTGTARSSTPTRPTPPLISPCFAKWASRGVLRTLRVTIPQTGTASIAPPNCRALAGTTPTVSGAGTTPSTVRVFWQVCAPCSPAFPCVIYLDW